MPRPPADQPLLNAELITRAALHLVDQDGLDDLSLRKLAATLKVTPRALYHYYPDKAALLHGIYALVFEEFQRPDLSENCWPKQMRELARRYRAVALKHPQFASYLFLPTAPVPRELDMLDAMYAALHDPPQPVPRSLQVGRVALAMLRGVIYSEVQGLFQRDLIHVQRRVASQSPERYPNLLSYPALTEDLTPDAYFELALDLLLSAIQSQFSTGHPSS